MKQEGRRECGANSQTPPPPPTHPVPPVNPQLSRHDNSDIRACQQNVAINIASSSSRSVFILCFSGCACVAVPVWMLQGRRSAGVGETDEG
ncbi:hypothetical protein Pcinc_021282 [Petrolisthes cinctipes]|uniref:Uncharacterized protein n=1 Tax=Petrolisthes cinctipes TaxID=88211 RepID=A0AAE1FHW7_PETCI|nr:hypothetical protein Pcinc_021282 [Petrolisthes cinctipes]